MKYGLCNLSIIPVRKETSDASEMVTQLLYGEFFKIIESRNNWIKIRNAFDDYEGWIDIKQHLEIDAKSYHELNEASLFPNKEAIGYLTSNNGQLMALPVGANLNALPYTGHSYEGPIEKSVFSREQLVNTCLLFLNTPYLWGGKSIFGIDCSGFTQLVYLLNGVKLLRDAKDQATQGETLSFIEESLPGDLAFFDNSEGVITHVGIILPNHQIIHAHGSVRVDYLDHSGIYNVSTKKHSHKLRVIKKII